MNLKDFVRTSVEETLNELLNKEAEELTSAAKYERTESRQGYRSGHYSRKPVTTSGEVRLDVPKLKGVPFETAATQFPVGTVLSVTAYRQENSHEREVFHRSSRKFTVTVSDGPRRDLYDTEFC